MRSRIDDAWRGDAAISSGVPWVLKYAATLHAGTTSGHANGNPEQIHHPAGFHDGGFRPGRKAASMMGWAGQPTVANDKTRLFTRLVDA